MIYLIALTTWRYLMCMDSAGQRENPLWKTPQGAYVSASKDTFFSPSPFLPSMSGGHLASQNSGKGSFLPSSLWCHLKVSPEGFALVALVQWYCYKLIQWT